MPHRAGAAYGVENVVEQVADDARLAFGVF
jgi:hypothetical protein